MKQKILSVLVIVAMVLCLMPSVSLAASATIGSGDSPYNLAAHSHSDGDTITISDGSSVTLEGNPATTYRNFKIVCGSNINLTLSNVNIDDSANDGVSPLVFTGTGNTLTLLGDSTLKGGSGGPGLQVAGSAALTFTSGSTGSLKAYGGEDAAGIGGGSGEAGGNITIEGGNIEAYSDAQGAGIGGGLNGSGGMITISGGTVTATVNRYGAGIGGGRYASAGTITISGGTINATGGKYGSAGIGCGTNGSGTGSITITGGTIAAAGGGTADDIGNGTYGSSVTTLSISGSADVFLKRGVCVSPSTTTHKYCAVTNITGGKAYGIDTPSGWAAPFGAWLIVNKVEYDANGGAGTIDDFVQRTGTTGALSDGSGFSLQYYHVANWNTAPGGSGTAYAGGADYSFTADAKLYAQWAINQYTVKYDANGGSGTMANQSFTYGAAQALASNAYSRTGYTFAGWAASATEAVVYTDGQSVSNLTTTNGATVTLYAKWTAVPTLASSVTDGKIYTGGRITLTPNITGGTWSFDSAFFTREDGTFTALKAGTSTITYTVEGQSTSYTVTITAAALPETGQDFTWAWALAGLAALAGAVTLAVRKRAAQD